MNNIISISIALLLLTNCKNISSSKELRSGYYGDNLLIVNYSGKLYGQYEFHENWSEELKYFEHECKFYFNGSWKSGDSIVKVTVNEECSSGYLIIQNDTTIIFKTDADVVCDYVMEDFEKGYECLLRKPIDDIISLGIIKSEKCKLYDSPCEEAISKSYIIKGDYVSIINAKKDWLKIKYNSPFGEEYLKWIKKTDLYPDNLCK
ncbi:MAG: hypothetical protein KF900_13785 [Bacteroidetes bacterium]|nr:hypothetical protein [Bacteroidota bacterium]